MIYRIGHSKYSLDITSYALGQGLYDSEGNHVADVGLAWNYASWFVLKMAAEPAPDALSGPFANLQSLEVALRRYLKGRDGTQEAA